MATPKWRICSQMLTMFEGNKIIFSSPEKFRMKKDILDCLKKANVEYLETDKFKQHISEADAIYMTRIQDEHDTDSFKSERSLPDFSLCKEDLPNLKKHTAIMHPLPRRAEISPDIDNDPRAKYWRQERNGMWTRAALLLLTARKDSEVIEYWSDISRQVNHTAKAKL